MFAYKDMSRLFGINRKIDTCPLNKIVHLKQVIQVVAIRIYLMITEAALDLFSWLEYKKKFIPKA